jgi:hypothetical protein
MYISTPWCSPIVLLVFMYAIVSPISFCFWIQFTCVFTLPLSTPIVLQLSLHNINCSMIDEHGNGAPGGRLVRGASAQ